MYYYEWYKPWLRSLSTDYISSGFTNSTGAHSNSDIFIMYIYEDDAPLPPKKYYVGVNRILYIVEYAIKDLKEQSIYQITYVRNSFLFGNGGKKCVYQHITSLFCLFRANMKMILSIYSIDSTYKTKRGCGRMMVNMIPAA